MFCMKLLYDTNIVEYVDLFEDEKYTKMAALCIEWDNLESIPEELP